MVLFRLLVTFAFVVRLLTGCCAGGCPAAEGGCLSGASQTCEHHGCHPGCGCGATPQSACCLPFGSEHSHEPCHHSDGGPCDCPGHSHHFCLGTHLFATQAERCELPPAVDVLIATTAEDVLARLVIGGGFAAIESGWPDPCVDARQARAALQVYVL